MNSIEFYSSLKTFPLSEFGNSFTKFTKTAFRLEQLSVFNVPQENEAFTLFLAGEKAPPPDFNAEWHEILRKAKTEKKNFSRVRVVDGTPTGYLKFEVLWAYKRNLEEGEDIKFLLRAEPSLFQTPVPVLKDFWLFDEQDCFLMEYDYCGTFLGVKKVPDDSVEQYVLLQHEVKSKSVSFENGLRELGL